MWLAKFKLIHDCIIGNRCKKFDVIAQSYEINEENTDDKILTQSLHCLVGEESNIQEFIKDLKKDKRTTHLEENKNSIFLIESSRGKPISQYVKNIFFIKPVIHDNQGWEHWEIAAYKKETLSKFITQIEPLATTFKLLRFEQVPLQDIYFPKVLPKITLIQKKAFELAVREGYFEVPRRTNLRKLANQMNISVSTYQNHLRKAESKVLPNILETKH